MQRVNHPPVPRPSAGLHAQGFSDLSRVATLKSLGVLGLFPALQPNGDASVGDGVGEFSDTYKDLGTEHGVILHFMLRPVAARHSAIAFASAVDETAQVLLGGNGGLTLEHRVDFIPQDGWTILLNPPEQCRLAGVGQFTWLRNEVKSASSPRLFPHCFSGE